MDTFLRDFDNKEENIKTYEHETYHDADLGMNWILMGFKRSSIHNI